MFEIFTPIIVSFFFTVLIANISSQCFKTLLKFVLTNEFNFKMLLEDGDYPSSHTTTAVTGIIIFVNDIFHYCRQYYDNELDLKITLIKIVTTIVCFNILMVLFILKDALGVRWAVQNNAIIQKQMALNPPLLSRELDKLWEELSQKINVHAGHMPHEVIGGAFLGSMIGLAYVYRELFLVHIIFIILIYFILTAYVFTRRRKNISNSK